MEQLLKSLGPKEQELNMSLFLPMAPVECEICHFPCVKNKRQVALTVLIKILP